MILLLRLDQGKKAIYFFSDAEEVHVRANKRVLTDGEQFFT